MTHLRIKQTQANDQAKVAVSGCSNKEQCFNSVTEPKCTLFGEIYNSFSYSCQNIGTSTNTALNMFLLLSPLKDSLTAISKLFVVNAEKTTHHRITNEIA